MGPSEYGVDLLLVACGPKRSSISKTRAFHLVLRDGRVGESPGLAGISAACCVALGKAGRLSGSCPFTGMNLLLLQALLRTVTALSEPQP